MHNKPLALVVRAAFGATLAFAACHSVTGENHVSTSTTPPVPAATHGYLRHFYWGWASNFESARTNEKIGRHTRTVWSVWVLGMTRPAALGVAGRGMPALVRSPEPERQA